MGFLSRFTAAGRASAKLRFRNEPYWSSPTVEKWKVAACLGMAGLLYLHVQYDRMKHYEVFICNKEENRAYCDMRNRMRYGSIPDTRFILENELAHEAEEVTKKIVTPSEESLEYKKAFFDGTFRKRMDN